MAVTQLAPNTIYLGGPRTDINDLAASEAITPGMLLERFISSTTIRVRKHATAGGGGPFLIAVEQSDQNKGISDAYAANDLVQAVALASGASAFVYLASGQNITAGQKLESNGAGLLRAYASGVILATALESLDLSSTAANTRMRVERV